MHLPQILTLLQTMASGDLGSTLSVGPGRGSHSPVIILFVPKESEATLLNCLKQAGVFMCKQASQPARASPPTREGRGLDHMNSSRSLAALRAGEPSIKHQRPAPLEEAKQDILFMTVF